MKLCTYLRESPALTRALRNHRRYSTDFGYTRNDIRYIRDNWELIWDNLCDESPKFEYIVARALMSHDVTDMIQRYYPPSKDYKGDPLLHAEHVLRKLVTYTTCFFGLTSTIDLMDRLHFARFISGSEALACRWIEECDTLKDSEIEEVQVACIANYIGTVAIINYPQQRYAGAFKLLTVTDMSDQIIYRDFLPRLERIFELNELPVVH